MFRVQKLLSNWGYCSRRKAEDLIKAGKVAVNGKTISIGDQAKETDTITVDGAVVLPEDKVYYLFYKPKNCATALSDQFQKTIMDFLSGIKQRVIPVGRLDYNTTGLLLLTNDGDWANSIMHPRYEIKKTYRAEVDRRMSEKAMKMLEEGVELDDGVTRPAQVQKVSDMVVDIAIHEGKNQIIKRMLKAVGYQTKELARIKVGALDLSGLEPGEYRQLTAKEVQDFTPKMG